MNPLTFLTSNLNFNLGGFNISSQMVRAGAIVFLVFLLIISLAQFRRHLVNWSLKGAVFGIFFGFLFALILEGFLIVGGRTAVTEFLGWKNAPKPILTALDAGRGKLVEVLGIEAEIPSSMASENPTVEGTVNLLQSLDPSEMTKIKSLICTP